MAAARYTPEQRAAIVARATEIGAGAAAKEHGVKAATLRAWMTRAGAKSPECPPELVKAEKNAELSRELRLARVADLLLAIAEKGTEIELGMIEGASLRDVVVARTRAIHDHQLLTGAATSRTESVGKENAHAIADELAQRRKAKAA